MAISLKILDSWLKAYYNLCVANSQYGDKIWEI